MLNKSFNILLLALLPVVLIIRKISMLNAQFSIKENSGSNYTLCIVHCTLIAMFIHAQFEGWWVGVGSISLPFFLIFLFTALLSNNHFKTIKEKN